MVSSTSVCMICGYVHGSGECKRGLNFSAPDLTEEKVQLPGQEQKPEGRKDDSGKLRFDLIPPHALEELAKVYSIGASKYEPYNWLKGLNWSRVYAAMQRHLHAWRLGEEIDPDNGQSHLSAVMWCAATLIEYSYFRREFDDRAICWEEVWAKVPGYPRYEVSSLGNVRKAYSLSARKRYKLPAYKTINPTDNGFGYLKFPAYDGHNKGKAFYVHRLVVELFLRPMEAGESVNHRDGIRNNNKAQNLEIVDASGNLIDAYRRGRERRKPGLGLE